VTAFPEPAGDTADPAVLFACYLDFYRDTLVRKVTSLTSAQARATRVPSGWTPIELLSHVAHMEQRWVVWGFLGEDVSEPWGDDQEGRWHVPEEQGVQDVVAMLRRVGERTTAVLVEHPLDEVGRPGGRFDDNPPTLAWICFHVLQEYARHAGHLDVVVELAGGELGE
jgi:uncharacterized damage-inducible protein DinB